MWASVAYKSVRVTMERLSLPPSKTAARKLKGTRMPLPDVAFLPAIHCFPIRAKIISDIWTAITCEDDERVLNKLVPGPPGSFVVSIF